MFQAALERKKVEEAARRVEEEERRAEEERRRAEAEEELALRKKMTPPPRGAPTSIICSKYLLG